MFVHIHHLSILSCLELRQYFTQLFQISHISGIKESDTGLAPPAMWDLAADKQTLQSEQPLQVYLFIKLE